MKILVIFTGGTIGSFLKNGYIGTDDGAKYTLLERFRNEKNVTFDTLCPYSILSENLSAKELNILQKEVSGALFKGYDGIIVTHGTDTLQYSAVSLDLAFSTCEIPILLVSAAYPLDDEKTNGYDNFKAALEFIKSGIAKGVFVSYKNENDNFTSIHKASSLLRHSEGSADLFSIDKKPFATFDGKKIERFGDDFNNRFAMGVVEYIDSPGILLIESHPADSFSYSLDRINAVIMSPYHSATLATASENLKAFCKKAKDAGVPVFVSGVRKGTSYESTRLFEDLGIIPLPYETIIFSYMKIWAGISRGEDLTEFVKKGL